MKFTACVMQNKKPYKMRNRDELLKQIDDMGTFLREQPATITKFDEQLVRWLIEKNTICEDRFTMEFRSDLMDV